MLRNCLLWISSIVIDFVAPQNLSYLFQLNIPFLYSTVNCTVSSMDLNNGVGSSVVVHDQNSTTSSRQPICHTLADNHNNYVQTGVPRLIRIFEGRNWMNLPESISRSFIEGFRGGRSFVEFAIDGEQILLMDFMSMVLINTRTGKLQSVAWIDESSRSFEPQVTLFQLAVPPNELEAWILACGSQPQGLYNHSPVQEHEAPLSCQPLIYPILARVQRNSPTFRTVSEMFLSGMGPFATADSIIDVLAFNGRLRIKAFEGQIEETTRERGNANVQRGWYASKDNNIIEALIGGFVHNNRSLAEAGVLGTGVYLVPQDRAFASVKLCGASKDGIQHMLLCRVILGNAEDVRQGSNRYSPQSSDYDLGVDYALNPKRYIVWSTHLEKYICPEYAVRFKLSKQYKDLLNGLNDIRFHIEHKMAWYDIPSSLEPFLTLYEGFYEWLPSWARTLYLCYFEEFKRNMITREDMVMKMTCISQELSLVPGPEVPTAIPNEEVGSTSALEVESTLADMEIDTSLSLAIGHTSAQEINTSLTLGLGRGDTSAEVVNTSLTLAIADTEARQSAESSYQHRQ
ncbi:putative inactive poly [Canna indica]|uniref:Inactive poly n=1 Tax=Canna indica TaxID=4628 RepID=A0AAQ3KIP8_9LILI|nr:putative inactive poly [Canna indica]